MVVLPAPCRPANRMILGRPSVRFVSASCDDPMISTISLANNEINCSPGFNLLSTCIPIAFSFTLDIIEFVTCKLTSASINILFTS